MKIINRLKEEGIIDKLAKLNYSLSDSNLIGQGNYGYAFVLGNNRILKLTSDDDETKLSSLLINKELDNVVNIYRVFRFKDNEYTFFIEEEKLHPLPLKIASMLESNYSFCGTIANFLRNYDDEKDMWQKIKEAEQVLNIHFPQNFIFDMIAAKQQLKQNSINKYRDFHQGNVLFDPATNNYKLIDLGITSSQQPNKIEIFEQRKIIRSRIRGR